MKQTLRAVIYESGKGWTIGENKITCKVVGEMADKSLVWEDETGKQYLRFKYCGKYYFETI